MVFWTLPLKLREAFIKNGQSWESVPTGGGVYPDPNLLTGFIKNTQNALKCIIRDCIVISSNVNDIINDKHTETIVLRVIYFTNIQ